MKEIIAFNFFKLLQRKIDALRGDISRSKFVTRLIKSIMSEGKSIMVKSPADKFPGPKSAAKKKPAIEFITDVFNPSESLFLDQDKKEKDQVSSNKTENAAISRGCNTDAIDWARGGLDFDAKKCS
jgi:hypothetical protein